MTPDVGRWPHEMDKTIVERCWHDMKKQRGRHPTVGDKLHTLQRLFHDIFVIFESFVVQDIQRGGQVITLQYIGA